MPEDLASTRKATHFQCSSGVHVRQIHFQLRQHAWASLLLLLSASAEKSRENVIGIASPARFPRLVLFQAFFTVPVVYLARLGVRQDLIGYC